jgi:hypothetical protein
VTAPNGIDPIPDALVYVPGAIEEFPQEVSCELCGEILDNARVLTRTTADGRFMLEPLPTREGHLPGETVLLVAQKGRFRRVVDVPIELPCEHNEIPEETFRLPGRDEGQSTIPRIAVATGDYDAMECVLLRFGLEAGQFDLYQGAAFLQDGSLAGFDGLLADAARLRSYNIVFINCTDNAWEGMLSQELIRNNVRDYVAAGGRLYVTDWSYDWIEQVPEFAPVIDYEPGQSGTAPETRDAAAIGQDGLVVQADVLDGKLADWLRAVEARAGQEVIDDADRVRVEHFVDGWVQQRAVASGEQTKVWIDADIGMTDRPLTTTFDLDACGRWLYSSYHTAGRLDELEPAPLPFPAYCGAGGLSPQERVLEYLILHVADCVQVD